MNNFIRRTDCLRSLSGVMGLAVVLTGVTVLVGWALDIGPLKSVVPGMVSMKANTAACFILTGLSLCLASRHARTPSAWLAGISILLPLVTIFQYLSGRDAGIDEFLFADPRSLAMGLPPGRMAMATGVAFVLIDAALLLLARRRFVVVAQCLTFAAVLIPLFSLLAYLFGERDITVASPYTSLAFHTAVAFAVLGAGILCGWSEAGPMAIFFAEDAGGATLRRLLPLLVSTTLLLGFITYLGAASGLYSFPAGMVLLAVVTAVAVTVAVWVNAWYLSRTDADRRQADEWFRQTLRSIGDAVIATDGEGRVTFLNPVAELMTGWSGPEAKGEPLTRVFRIVNETSREPVEDPVGRVLKSGHVVGLANHTLLISRDGTERPISDSAAPITDRQGRTVGVVLVFGDMSEKKRSEEENRRLDERRRLALDSAQLGSWHIDPAAETLETDERFRMIFGVSGGECSYQQAVAALHDDDRARVLDAIAASVRPEDPQPYSTEYRVVHPDGSVRWVSAKGRSNTTGEDGRRIASFDGTLADITDRKRSEESKERRARQLQKLADIANCIHSAHDLDSVIGVVTGEARILFGAHQAATSVVLDPNHPINVVSNSEEHHESSKPPDIDGLPFYEAINEANESIRLSRAELDAHPRWRPLREFAGISPSVNGLLAAPLIGRNGKKMGLIQLLDRVEGEFTEDDEAILVQLSQLTAIAVENARLYQELRSNDERKDEFLAMLAHELRNPLAAIGNAVKLSAMSDAREHLDFSREVISRQMHHLTRLIDDLMDVSRITRGKIELRRDVMEVTPILESAAATVRTLAEERKHTLEIDIERGNLWANVDPTRLEQVLVNLLNNAAKYSENSGLIRLTARNQAGEVAISVKDRGVGIPPEKLPEMFVLFAQADRSLARSEGGLGIGLTVVKKLVEMHGGSVTAKSEGLGKGSEFIIRLPAARRPSQPTAHAADPTKVDDKKARILVVDDNVDTVRGMARLLKLIGHDVATAHNGLEAIEVARTHRPQFVLLDIGLPGMSGYEVAAKLRQDECCRESVIVAVSGYGQDEDRRRAKEAGFDFHLTKPLDHDALISLLAVGADGPA